MLLYKHQNDYLHHKHPDIGATLIDIANSIELIAASYPDALLAAFAANDWPSLVHLASDIDAGALHVLTTPMKYVAAVKREAAIIKSLYSTSKNFPEAFAVNRSKSVDKCFWGSYSY